MQQPSHLAASNLNLNQVLVCIKHIPRIVSQHYFSAEPPFKKLIGFERLRLLDIHFTTLKMEVAYFHAIYDTISMDLDYVVTWWDDSQYRLQLRSLVSEQEWMQFKTDILRIYAEQNAKRAALRKLIQFNRYRPIAHLFLALLSNAKAYLDRRSDPLRDPLMNPPTYSILLFPLILLLSLILMVASVSVLSAIAMIGIVLINFLLSLCIVLDFLLMFPRYLLFRETEKSFLESAMAAHPDLDPVLVEEELVQQLRQLTVRMNRHHRGVHCQFTSTLEHRKGDGADNPSSDWETFQIQFLKFSPDVPL
jgi:hypothetical protein